MPPILRRVLAVLAGTIAAMVVVTLMDGVVGRLYPLPEGTDVRDPEVMRTAIAALPFAALALLVVGWAIAAAVGAFVAVRLTRDGWTGAGITVVVLLLAATVANLLMLPHPAWVWPAALLLVPAAGLGGARAAAARGKNGPQGP
nr:hypothetical protein [uncultured bacterium]